MSLSLRGKHSNTLKNRMEQHLQDVVQKVQHDKHSDTFAADFDQHLNQKPTPQQCHEIIKL